jgi:mono/diheme cytochrome c family protein
MVGCRNGALADAPGRAPARYRPVPWRQMSFALLSALLLAAAPAHGQVPSPEAGAAVYALRCSGCHGVDLNNTSGGQVFDLRKLRPGEHDRFVDSVTSGKDNMPSWYGILTAAEIDAIWAYIRATVDR